MCKNCCVRCFQLECICSETFSQMTDEFYPFFTCTIGVDFDGDVDPAVIVDSLSDKYMLSSDRGANRKQSQVKKQNGEKDHMYHSLSIKRSFNYKGKLRNTCCQLSNHHLRVMVPCWDQRVEIITHYIALVKKCYPLLQLKNMRIITQNLAVKSTTPLDKIDLFALKKHIEEIGRAVRKDFRVYFNPKVGGDQAIVVEFIGKRGKLRISSTKTMMFMGINDPGFMNTQKEYFLDLIKEWHKISLKE